MLHEPAARLGVAIHAYALLTDEVLLLATPAEASALGRLMQAVGRRYGSAHNRRHGRRGALWDGRFRSSLIDAQTMLLPATLHIESLAVRADLAAMPADWAWSSAAHHIGRRRDLLVTDHPRYWYIGNTPFDRELAHAHELDEALQRPVDNRLLQASQRPSVVGPPEFVRRIGDLLGRQVTRRPPGRPKGALGQKYVPEDS
jgi:putative transposase